MILEKSVPVVPVRPTASRLRGTTGTDFSPDSARSLRPAGAFTTALMARMEKQSTKLQAKPVVSP
jgi:hypothetical protein